MNLDCGKYIIKSDPMNLWIEEKYAVKTGKNAGQESTKVITGYHSTFSGLLESFMLRKIRGSEAETVQQLLEDMRKVENDLKELIKGGAEVGCE